MLLEIGIVLFARSRGKAAEQKGHPASTYALVTGGLGLGGDILGVAVGVTRSGEAGGLAVLFAIVGAFIGSAIGALIVERLPDIRDPDRVGPSSMKVQIAGSRCTQCEGGIATALDGALCPRCGETVHLTCGPAHDQAKHPEAQDYRSEAKKKKKRKKIEAASDESPAA